MTLKKDSPSHYPVFISIQDTEYLLGICKTTIYERISEGKLKAAKMGRSRRILFPSVISYALEGLQSDPGRSVLSEMSSNPELIESWMIAEIFAQRLCYKHSGDDIGQLDVVQISQSAIETAKEVGSSEKNYGKDSQ